MNTTPRFWRDPALPQVELRYIEDGRQLRYAPHSHRQWSLGAILAGQSHFEYAGQQQIIKTGQLLLINPHQVHACNPCESMRWSYYMLYVDTDWLTRLRQDLGELQCDQWQDLSVSCLTHPLLFEQFTTLATGLFDPQLTTEQKEADVSAFLRSLFSQLRDDSLADSEPPSATLQKALVYLHKHYDSNVTLETLCALTDLNKGALIRLFRQACGMTPHAYLTNLRIQMAQIALRSETPLAEVALTHGFADQPHFQRTFKRLLAATPIQYRDGPKRLHQQYTAAEQQQKHQ